MVFCGVCGVILDIINLWCFCGVFVVLLITLSVYLDFVLARYCDVII